MEVPDRYADSREMGSKKGSSEMDIYKQSPTSLPLAQTSDLPTNEVARTTSKRRRPSGVGNGKSDMQNFTHPPAAPEVPKAPPFAYRATPTTNGHVQSDLSYPPSFAERARILTGKTGPKDNVNIDPERKDQPSKPKTERRASLNRPIGGLYTEIQQHNKRDSYPSTASGPTSPRRSSIPSTTQHHSSDSANARQSQEDKLTTVPKGFREISSSAQPVARRSSTTQPPRREWASQRSPLQDLEAKLEKRARVEQAEHKLRRSKGGSQRERQIIEPTVDRIPSRRVSAGAETSRSKGAPKQREDTLADRGNFGLGIRDTSGGKLSEEKGALELANRKIPRQSVNTATGRSQENALGSSRGTPTAVGENRWLSQQQDRAVRFQGEDDPPLDAWDNNSSSGLDSQRRNRPSKELDTDPASAEARAARREQLRQSPGHMADQRESRDVIPQLQNLNESKIERSPLSTAPHRRAPDPIPAEAVKYPSRVPKYEIPPQTASGIQARQRVGFGSQAGHPVDLPAQKSHHLSNLLHRGHDPVHIHEKSGERPQTLNEWRQGGVARLTAVDFSEETGAKSHQTWGEAEGSGRRRRSQRASRGGKADAQMQGDDIEASIGKSILYSFQSQDQLESQPVSMTSATSQIRPYLIDNDYLGAKKSFLSRFKANLGTFASRPIKRDYAVLSSTYSYSCPDLADHDPAHASHICEPYLSPELIQSMRSIRIRPAPGVQTFSPPLYLKCGPLLRYVGLKRDKLESRDNRERVTWRGSVMILTTDAESKYEPAPTLRLFPEPMELLPPPPEKIETENRDELPSEIADPIAGLPKLSRTGRTVYVKPVDDLGKDQESKDLSQVEDDDGLFEETRTAAVPSSYGTPDFHHVRNGPQPKTPLRQSNAKRGQFVQGCRLHAERGVTFWRFNLEVELGHEQARIAYSINNGPAVGFWVPARSHTMNVMFHSCNGFSMSVNPDDFSGPDPLWRDVLNSHQIRPFHVMIGGGDQIYNDAVMKQSPLFSEWLEVRNNHQKFEIEFSIAMQEELETFYLERYAMWFSQGLFGMANSQIPMVNMWDDHDIIDGFGSYPHDFMSTPVFCGLGAVAYKYYMLFQHQTVSDETSADEPSWLMGAARGPYINELSRSIFVSLGQDVAFLAVDCRTERQWDEVLSEASYELIFDRCRREIIEGETRHLIILLGIPIAYPRLVWLENLLTSRVMDPIKALGRAGIMGSFLNKFNGGVEILDDLDDHWTAKHHKQERNWFVQELQQLAAEKSVRVTILGGDVHLAAIGQFYSNPKLGIPKDQDHRYMANVISSAIVNTPPPEMMGDILNKRNKVHHLDHETDEDMIPMFTHDVDGKMRNNKRLLPRRNWCSIREYHPGSTPPPTPSPPPSEPQSSSDNENSPQPPPTRLQRTMSLTRGEIKPGKLFRRLSGRGAPSSSYLPARDDDRDESISPSSPDVYFPHQLAPLRSSTAPTNGHGAQRQSSAPLSRPGFQRRPTNMTEKAAVKGDVDNMTGHINLEHGLDIVLNCEVNQRDPAGSTMPYRLLIPALWYGGSGDENKTPFRKQSVLKRLTSLKGRRTGRLAGGQGRGDQGGEYRHSGSEMSASDSETLQEEERRPRRWSFGLTRSRQYSDQTPPSQRGSREQDRIEGPNSQQTVFPERPQHQRQSEDRIQQTSPYDTAETSMQQQAFDRLTGQRQESPINDQIDAHEDMHRDSIDYHEHLDTVSSQANAGIPGRRPSKVNRMLGVSSGRQGSANAIPRRSVADGQSPDDLPTPDSPLTQSASMIQGYGGIDNYYTDTKRKRSSWKSFLP